MKGEPLLPLPRTQVLIRQEVESWPHKPDPEYAVYSQMHPGALIWVRTMWGIKQYQLRIVRAARGWRRHRGRRFIVAHDGRGVCHIHWLSDVIRVEPRIKELTR